jgi:hypothetical protein
MKARVMESYVRDVNRWPSLWNVIFPSIEKHFSQATVLQVSNRVSSSMCLSCTRQHVKKWNTMVLLRPRVSLTFLMLTLIQYSTAFSCLCLAFLGENLLSIRNERKHFQQRRRKKKMWQRRNELKNSISLSVLIETFHHRPQIYRKL